MSEFRDRQIKSASEREYEVESVCDWKRTQKFAKGADISCAVFTLNSLDFLYWYCNW